MTAQRSPEAEAIYQRGREEIAQKLHELDIVKRHLPSALWGELAVFIQDNYKEEADQILSIPGIAILVDK